jgi:DNA-binding GntR family transcriptional regulator
LQELNVAEHAAIRDAILARSAKAAREAMGRHISNAARRLGYELEDGVGL